ncbi:MAG: hypothetical protein ACR2G5_07170 [Pyrinomonadaceae bacterium]
MFLAGDLSLKFNAFTALLGMFRAGANSRRRPTTYIALCYLQAKLASGKRLATL